MGKFPEMTVSSWENQLERGDLAIVTFHDTGQQQSVGVSGFIVPSISKAKRLPSGKHTKNDGKSPFFMGFFELNDLNGHVPWRTVSLPEGRQAVEKMCEISSKW